LCRLLRSRTGTGGSTRFGNGCRRVAGMARLSLQRRVALILDRDVLRKEQIAIRITVGQPVFSGAQVEIAERFQTAVVEAVAGCGYDIEGYRIEYDPVGRDGVAALVRITGFDETRKGTVATAAVDVIRLALATETKPGRPSTADDLGREPHADVVTRSKRPRFSGLADENEGLSRVQLPHDRPVVGMVVAAGRMLVQHGLFHRQWVDVDQLLQMLGHGGTAQVDARFLDVRITGIHHQLGIRVVLEDLLVDITGLLRLAGIARGVGKGLVTVDLVTESQRSAHHFRADRLFRVEAAVLGRVTA